MPLQDIELAYGSVVGKDHISTGKVLVGKNNQDAIAIRRAEWGLVVIICDGCGSGAHSEFGAIWGANNIAQKLSSIYESYWCADARVRPSVIFEVARRHLITDLHILASQMSRFEDTLAFINDYLLFTCIGVFATEDFVEIFSIGDGFYACDYGLGPIQHELSFPGNAPPYLAYELAREAVSRPYSLKFDLLESFATNDLKYALVGSDGVADLVAAADKLIPGKDQAVGDISQFWTDDRYYANPTMVNRKLRLLNSEVTILQEGRRCLCPRLLPDDTTFVVLRQKRVAT